MERLSKKSFPYRIFISIPLLAMVFYVFSCKEEDEMAKLDALSEQYKNAETDEEKAALADADEVFMVVEDQPTPEGGMEAFYDYIRTHLKYPAEARSAGIEGKVFVQFIVDTDGSLKDVEVLKGIGGGCNEEALEVVKNSPAWNPGLQRGQAVKVRMVLPITFSLENGGSPSANTDKPQLLEDKMQVQLSRNGNVITGNITSSEGKHLAGVNIIIKGSTTGTVSDMNGQFSITIPSGTDAKELVFSSVGFETKSVTL